MPRTPTSIRAILALGAASVLSATAAQAATLYVDANLTTGANDGASWDNAYQGAGGLQAALAAAVSGDEIWVADGRYIPGAAQTSTFTLKNGVALYAGFAGGESALDQRNPAVNIAVLSGDLMNNDTAYPSTTGWDENAYHVVTANNRDQTAVLDGFTITHGYADGFVGDQDRGSAILCIAGNPTFRALRVTNNRVAFSSSGGTAYLSGSSPTFTDCTFDSNHGGSFGGACFMRGISTPVWERCLIIDNSSNQGGGICVNGSCTPDFINCVFAGNRCPGSGGGGALSVDSNSTVDLINCTLYANRSSVVGGGAVRCRDSTTRVSNCIVYANTGVQDSAVGQLNGSTFQVIYSCVQGGFAGAGNISRDPRLFNHAAGDFRPAPGSPVIDAGRNDSLAAVVLTDLAHQPRFVDDPATSDTGVGTPPIIDMGALEHQPVPDPACPSITVDPQSQSACRSGNATFTMTYADGASPDLQWYKDGVPIDGAIDPVFTAWGDEANEGEYTVVVSDVGCKPITSAPAFFAVCTADFNCDGVVNSNDVSDFINQWFIDQTHPPPFSADIDGNGVINSTDVSEFINIWFHDTTECAG